MSTSHEEKAPVSDDEKKRRYEQVEAKLKYFDQKYSGCWPSLSIGAKMTTLVSILHEFFRPDWGFVGFYVVAGEKTLEIGPYQYSEEPVLATPLIPFGKGVCGECAAKGATQIREDVSVCTNYIPCDLGTKSEMVVPVWSAGEAKLAAVLDIDSPIYSNFNSVDQDLVEGLLKRWL
jgi:L-methionine (R)-S-oxide reductase